MNKKLKDYITHFIVFFILSLFIRDAHFMLWILLSFVWFILEHVLNKVYTSDKTPKYLIDNMDKLFKNNTNYHRDCLEVLIILAINLAGAYSAKVFI